MLTATELYSARPLTPQEEATFFTKLQLANGTYKTTVDHRMDDLNKATAQRWQDIGFRPREIMDVGVSSGISTAEWLDALWDANFQVRMTGTDLALWANVIPLWPGAYALESDGHVLRHIVFKVPIRPWRQWKDYLTGYAFVSSLANVAARCRSHDNLKKVLLVSPRALRPDAIEWIEDDVFAPNPAQFVRRFDAIRAANILNCGYFNTGLLRHAVLNLKDRLAGPNARLIINRTLEDGSNQATMFRLTDANRFEVELRLGQGSEIENTILSA
jgi:hypothetical protein